MPFSTETEQIKKFENDEVAQHYFEVLRTLISKKSIFAQQVGLQEVANYLGEIFTAAGAKVMIDDSYTALRQAHVEGIDVPSGDFHADSVCEGRLKSVSGFSGKIRTKQKRSMQNRFVA